MYYFFELDYLIFILHNICVDLRRYKRAFPLFLRWGIHILPNHRLYYRWSKCGCVAEKSLYPTFAYKNV